MSDLSTSSPADGLDRLLASRPVTARPDFAACVRARLHENPLDDAADIWIDHELARHAVQGSGNFAAGVHNRIAAGEGDEKVTAGSRWRTLVPFAAAAALLFAVLSVSTTPTSEPVRIASIERSVSPLAAPATSRARAVDPFVFDGDSGAATLEAFSAPPSARPVMASGADRDLARLLVLADGLGLEARALLERPDIHSWLALAE